jgi:hypothetical protein
MGIGIARGARRQCTTCMGDAQVFSRMLVLVGVLSTRLITAPCTFPASYIERRCCIELKVAFSSHYEHIRAVTKNPDSTFLGIQKRILCPIHNTDKANTNKIELIHTSKSFYER